MTRLPAVLAVCVLALTLAGCAAPAPERSASPAVPHPVADPIVGAALEKETAWGECQQLVIRKLKLTDADVRVWSGQSESRHGAAWVAVGRLRTGSLGYRYRCTVASDAKGSVSSESLDWIYPA